MAGGDGVSSEGRESKNGGGEVTIHVRCTNGSKFCVQISLDSSIRSFKSVLAQNCDIPAEQQRLIYKGRILKDDQSLQSYGLEAEHAVHLVRGFNPSASTNPANATPTNPAPTTSPGLGSNQPDPFSGSGFGAPLFPNLGSNGLGGNNGLFGAGLPEFEQVQRQLTQNPNMMREIMDMPLVQNLMNNPDVMRNMIMNNPQMREVMDRNPELAHVLNDPATLRQTMEAARNPEIMREMMRNTDRAMSNIEASPEGFNMLRRMYENVQEPLLNASTASGDSGNDGGSNTFSPLFGGGAPVTNPVTTGSQTTNTDSSAPAPNTNPLPNPWASGGVATQTINTQRSNSARPAPLGGDLAFPGLEGMMGSTPDPNSVNQFMQNPAVSQMMQTLLSDPQYVNQVLGTLPQARGILDANSQIREIMQNPEFMRQLTSPETMQQMLALQQSIMQQQQPSQIPGENVGGTGVRDTMGLEMLMNMFGGLGMGANPNASPQSNVPPEERYATQLAQLQEMGFFDAQENIRALTATSGNVHAAVERLLGSPGQ